MVVVVVVAVAVAVAAAAVGVVVVCVAAAAAVVCGLWFGVSGLWFVVCCERLGAIWAHLGYVGPSSGLCWPMLIHLRPKESKKTRTAKNTVKRGSF